MAARRIRKAAADLGASQVKEAGSILSIRCSRRTFAKLIAADLAKWTPIIKASGASAE